MASNPKPLRRELKKFSKHHKSVQKKTSSLSLDQKKHHLKKVIEKRDKLEKKYPSYRKKNEKQEMSYIK